MAAELTRAELRKAFDVSQEELAKILDVKQANASKIERREDMRLSTLVIVRNIHRPVLLPSAPCYSNGSQKKTCPSDVS